ncbi:hypothetical protein FRB90_011336, partial [Tulasnella sp. 427]
ETVPLATPNEKDEAEGFVTPRTSLEKPDPMKDAAPLPAAPNGAVVLNDEPTALPEKKLEEPVNASTPVATPVPARPPRASSPVKRPGTPSSTQLPPSAPSTPSKEHAQLPPSTGTPNATTASPSAPPPVPRRAAGRRVVTNRTSMLLMGKEKDAPNDKERRNSIGQIMAEGVSEDLRRASLEGKPLSRPGTPSNDRPSSPSPARPASPLRTLKRSSLTVAPAEVSPLTAVSPEQERPKVEEAAIPPPLPPRDHDAPPVPSKQQDVDLNGRSVEEDDRVTVTDRTWEDRVWKELTRLKMEMFWARVGGVQLPSS